MNDRPTALIIA